MVVSQLTVAFLPSDESMLCWLLCAFPLQKLYCPSAYDQLKSRNVSVRSSMTHIALALPLNNAGKVAHEQRIFEFKSTPWIRFSCGYKELTTKRCGILVVFVMGLFRWI